MQTPLPLAMLGLAMLSGCLQGRSNFHEMRLNCEEPLTEACGQQYLCNHGCSASDRAASIAYAECVVEAGCDEDGLASCASLIAGLSEDCAPAPEDDAVDTDEDDDSDASQDTDDEEDSDTDGEEDSDTDASDDTDDTDDDTDDTDT